MLATCNKCRTTRDVKLRVENPNNIKINRASLQNDKSVKMEPVCMACGTPAVVSTFFIQLMVDKREFVPEEKSKTSKFRCHACQTDQSVKIDSSDKPRCLRCGGVVKLTTMMLNVMKKDSKFAMSTDEMQKFGI